MKNNLTKILFLGRVMVVVAGTCLASFAAFGAVDRAEHRKDYSFCRQRIEQIAGGRVRSHAGQSGFKIPFLFQPGTDAMAGGNSLRGAQSVSYTKVISKPHQMPETMILTTSRKENAVVQYELKHIDQCTKTAVGDSRCRKKTLVFNVDLEPRTGECFFRDVTYMENEGQAETRTLMNDLVCGSLKEYSGKSWQDLFLADDENRKGRWKNRFKLKFEGASVKLKKPSVQISQLDRNCRHFVKGYKSEKSQANSAVKDMTTR